MKHLKLYFPHYFAILLFLILHAYGFSNQKQGGMNLTNEERVWLQKHPVIRVTPDPDYAPYEFYGSYRIFSGIAEDYLKLIAIKTGIKFEIVYSDDRARLFSKIKDLKADVIPFAVRTPERSGFLFFTS